MEQIKYKAKIFGYEKILSDDIFNSNIFEIDFDGRLKLKILHDGRVMVIIDAMNGYGDNCLEIVKGELFKIEKVITNGFV